MPIDPEKTWIDTVNKIPPGKNAPDQLKKLSDAVDAAMTGKAQLTGILGKVSFTFEKGIFYAGLLQLGPTKLAPEGVAKFSNAWSQAIVASKMVVPPGASLGAPTPPTIWSVVASTVLDPPSLAAAKSYLEAELLSAGLNPVADSNSGKIGPALRKAALLLTYTVTGLDSTPTPAGPLPLVAPACALM